MYVTWNRTLAGNVIQYKLQVMMTLSLKVIWYRRLRPGSDTDGHRLNHFTALNCFELLTLFANFVTLQTVLL